MRQVALAVVVVGLVSLPVWAQSTDATGFVLELPASARALSMGNTIMLAESDPAALFYNPALVTRGGGTELSVQRYGSTGTLGAISTGTGWAGGNLAIGVQVLQYGAQSLDPASIARNEAQLFLQGANGASELAGTLAYGTRFKGFRVGLAARVFEQRIREGSAGAAFADLGVARDAGAFTFGLSAQHLGPNITMHAVTRPLPTRVTLAASMRRRPVGPLDLGWSASVARQRDGEIVPAGGVEVSYWPVRGRTFTARVGVRGRPDRFNIGSPMPSPVAFGLGFTGDRISISYAMQPFNGSVGPSHRIGLRWQ